jgi:hypothetical protein
LEIIKTDDPHPGQIQAVHLNKRGFLMKKSWYWTTMISSVLFASFSTIHLIDNFLHEVPGEFNPSVPFTKLFTLFIIISIFGLMVGAAKLSRTSFQGLLIAGSLITAAQFTKSFPEIYQPGPWRSGVSSVLIIVGLTISAITLMISSYMSWRFTKRKPG